MTPSAIDTAAHHLVDASRRGTPGMRIPASCRPADIADALLIQRRVTALRTLQGERIGGWKCAVPSAEKTIVAPMFATTIRSSSPCAMPVVGGMASIEPEVAFVMGRDLPPRATPYSAAEVRAAIAETRLVLELMGCRYDVPGDATFPEMLSDSANHYGLFRGPVVAGGPERMPASFALAIDGADGSIYRGEGRHPDGDPLRPLVWLANFLGAASGWNEGLAAGAIVTTGSYAGRALDVPAGTPLTITYGDVGSLSVTLAPA